MQFASDTLAPACPEVMESLARANHGKVPSYGDDDLTRQVEARVSELFEREARVVLVATGTAANGLALAALCPPWGAVYCHEAAHIEKDECGAVPFFSGGAVLSLLPAPDGRLAPETLAAGIPAPGRVHEVQPGAVSLTQATEWGTVYRPDRIAALAEVARDRGLPLHMDGTRFANAVARLGVAPADLSWRAGVDVLCLGGTKNGAMAVEAVVMFDPARAWEVELRRKRAGHLPAKMRFLAAQMLGLLEDGVWLRNAARANAMADRLAAGLAAAEGVELTHPVEANIVFADLPRAGAERLEAAGSRLDADWVGDTARCRFVCPWSTTEAEVDALLAAL